ncbi:MAG: aminotransferase class IV, partial [Magnetococcales bacterium]|nr:aminotransferase class IV [Magnetococcales bacterium]
MHDKDGKIWMDGKLTEWRDAKVHVLTHTLHYGLGVFEGIRCYKTASGPAIFRLPEHINRLFQSAHILNMAMPFTREEISNACLAVLKAN